LLRRGECCHCRRWQQCFKNAQQQKCRNPPHVVSVHGVPAAAKQLVLTVFNDKSNGSGTTMSCL
jgi:hypothetical protein